LDIELGEVDGFAGFFEGGLEKLESGVEFAN
jgi:hypothetical protein